MVIVSLALGCSFSLFGEPEPLRPLPQNPDPTSPTDTALELTGDLRLVDADPAWGPEGGGTEVTLSGAFPTELEGLVVMFGDAQATILESTGSALRVRTPARAPGAVAITVTQGPRFSLRDEAFVYFADREGRVGLVGEVRRNNLVGGYWADESSGVFELAFVDLPDWSLADDYGTSGDCTYAFEPTREPTFDTGAKTLSMTSKAGTVTLEPLTKAGWYGALAGDTDVPPATSFDLDPVAGDTTFPAFGLPELVTIPEAFGVTSPVVDGAVLQAIPQSFTLRWGGPRTADYMVLVLQRAFEPDDELILVDEMRCTFPDTGSFDVDGTLWPDWYPNEVLFIRLARVVTSTRTLPHDNAEARIAGSYTVVGAGFTQ